MDAREERRRSAAAYWGKAREALFKGDISAGAFALLHHLERLSRLFGYEAGELEISGRRAAREAKIDSKTYLRRIRQLMDSGLIEREEIGRRRGFHRFYRLRMPGVFSFSSSVGKNPPHEGKCPSESVGKTPSESVGKKGPAHILTSPNGEPPFKERLKAVPSGEVLSSPASRGSEETSGLRPQASSKTPAGAAAESRIMGRLRDLIGNRAMGNDGGKWRQRIRRDHGKVVRVLAEFEDKLREGAKVRTPGGYLEDLWRRFE